MNRLLRVLLRIIVVLFLVFNIIIACHAYKFTHYYDRGSVTLIPENQKSGWDKTKDILFGFTFVKQENSKPDTLYQTINLLTAKKVNIEAWYFAVPDPKGTVILFHGHGGKKSGNLVEAKGFRSMGFNTMMVDFEAHGNSGGNTTTIGFKEAEDVKLAYDYVRNLGEKHIILWGISMGAATVSKAINDYSLQPEKVILEMPFASMLDAVKGRIKMMKLPPQPIATFLTFWGGVENGFWAFNYKPAEYVKHIYCPVLLQWGRHDPRVMSQETYQVFGNIPGKKKLVIYEESGHESLCQKEHDKWMENVSSFLKP